MTRYYLVKEVDGIVVRKTEIVHEEPRDAKGRYVSPDANWQTMAKKIRQARKVRCPRCGHEFLVA